MLRSHVAISILGIGLVCACSSSGGDSAGGSSIGPAGVAGSPPSALRAAWPAPLIDPNQGGSAPALQLVGLAWGRLVDVYALEPGSGARQLAWPDFVIGESIMGDGVDYELVTLHGSGEVQLTILHPPGSAAFNQALAQLQASLVPIQDATLPPWSVVPRNAALELRFQDLLDPTTVTAETVRVAVGYPPEQPFEARVLADPNHGDLADPDGDGEYELFPTRVIVDLTVDELEALESDPPLAVNALGLPPATTTNAPNARLRLPTRIAPAVGQTAILRNLAGNGLSFTGNGSNDPSAPTADVVRSFRSGGPSDVTGDPSNGFLRDLGRPTLVATLEVALAGAAVADPGRAGVFTFPSMSYAVSACAASPEPGDRLQIGSVWTVVEGYAQRNGALVSKPRVRVVHPAGAMPQAGPATLTTRYEAGLAECFLGFDPPAALPPTDEVSPDAGLLLGFSEAMAAESLAAFSGVTVARVPSSPQAFDLVVGAVVSGADARSFRFVPTLPLTHQIGSSELYYLAIGAGAEVPTDLAGNALAAIPPTVEFALDPSAPTALTGGLVLRFDGPDELYDDGLPELRGQHLFDLDAGELRSRPVNRFSIAADTDKPVPSVMTVFPPGVQVPLTPLGAKLQTLWRYCDLGWSFFDETNTNVDVEGLAWAPVFGQVVTDAYDEFSIRLAHSSWLPDESLNPMTGFPTYPASGLVKTYAQNSVPSDPDGGEVVHPRERGYTVSPADLFTSESGKLMMPWPLNRGIPIEDFEYYTWRDTARLDRAGDFGSGVLLTQEVNVLGLPPSLISSVYSPGDVRTIGLPLLIEYRCYPDDQALGLNAFEILLAANSSARPNFRAYSAGGFNVNGQPVIVDPDQQPQATGGFNPSSNPPGLPTLGVENAFYTGQIDLVTRVARSHSIWLPTGAGLPSYAPPVVLADLPAGTQLEIAWRGASDIVGGTGPSLVTTDATVLDPYGDPRGFGLGMPVLLGGDETWYLDPSALDGAAWIQLRVTFVGNAASGATAALDALGLAWAE